MDTQKLTKQLLAHEGIRLKPYFCSAGMLTIGIGRNLEKKGIHRDEAFYMLTNDIQECLVDILTIFADFYEYPENIQLVLMDMRFNLGPGGFRRFRNMIKAVKQKDWEGMKREMIDSKWYGQVGRRSSNLARMVESCIKKKGGDNYEQSKGGQNNQVD